MTSPSGSPSPVFTLCDLLTPQGKRHTIECAVGFGSDRMPTDVYISYRVGGVLVDSVAFIVDPSVGEELSNPDTAIKYAQPLSVDDEGFRGLL